MGQVVLFPKRFERAEPVERPVNRAKIAHMFGVNVKTVDRWVARDGMPEGECWFMAGMQRRYYPNKVRAWLANHN